MVFINKGIFIMKNKFNASVLLLLLCSFAATAQQPDTGGSNSYRPITKLGMTMSTMTNPADLKQAYDTIKYTYGRRYFIHELPGYFSSKGITVRPSWVNSVIISCLDSSNANLVNESILSAGAFNIACGAKIMDIYMKAPSKYGHHSERIRTSIIHCLRQIHDPNNSQYFYTILANGNLDLVGEQFEELLLGMDENRSVIYSPKLSEDVSWLSSLQGDLEKQKKSGPQLETIRKILGKVYTLQSRIASDQAIANGGGK